MAKSQRLWRLRYLPLGALVLPLSALVLTIGCSTSSNNKPVAQIIPQTAPPREVLIISDPPGARIEVNQDYLGDAPITIKVPQINGRFANSTTIRALPGQAGGYVQTKVFFAQMGPVGADEIPSRILFVMSLAPGGSSN
jgi:PEGA domain